MKHLFTIGLTLVAATVNTGCQHAGAISGHTQVFPSPRQYIFLLDLSLSRTSAMKDEGNQFLDGLSNDLQFGDHVTILRVQQVGLQDHQDHWSDDMPVPADPTYINSRDQKLLITERENVKSAVKVLSNPPPADKFLHTDLLTTLNLTGEYAHDYRTRPTTIVVLSDMLQSTSEIEMEHAKRMPSRGWLAKQEQLGLVPKLPGACIVVVGADPTTPEGVRVRAFWEEYFAAAGATLIPENYRVTPPASGSANCT